MEHFFVFTISNQFFSKKLLFIQKTLYFIIEQKFYIIRDRRAVYKWLDILLHFSQYIDPVEILLFSFVF